MKKISIKVIAEISIFAGLCFVFDFIQSKITGSLFPNGGSIGFAMIPVLIISIKRGLLPGILCGLIASLLQMLGGIWVIPGADFSSEILKVLAPFTQVMLDYVLGYTVVGLAGLFSRLYKNERSNKYIILLLAGVVGGFSKYFVHVLSGLIFWPGEIFGISGFMYSFVYNGLYVIPSIIISLIILLIIQKTYKKIYGE